MRRLSLRLAFPSVAAVLFVILSLAAYRQAHVIDLEGWGRSSDNKILWGQEPVDIGTPADVSLLALNLPALIALLPLSPLTYWVNSEVILRIAWGLAAVGQWFLIGRYLDILRGPRPASDPSPRVLLQKVLVGIAMVVGSIVLGVGVFSAAVGHHSFWAFARDASFVFWGLIAVVAALRWRSSASWPREHFNSLHIS